MTNREHVLKYEGRFSISGGEVWTISNGHDVHFALNPKAGCHGANITVGLHKPGKEFTPHKHPISEEVPVIHGSRGRCYLYDGWILVETGDIVFAPPDALHDTHNLVEDTEDSATLGIATPPQLDLYLCAGYDILRDNSGGYVEEV